MFKQYLFLMISVATCHMAAMNNKYFSLSKRSLTLAMHLAQSQQKDLIIENLKHTALNNPKDEKIIALPQEILDLVNENLAWNMIKNFNLEQTKINLLDMEHELDKNNTVFLQAQKIYSQTFEKKFNSTDDTIHNKLYSDSLKETATIMLQYLESIVSLDGDISVIKLDKNNRQETTNMVSDMYFSEGCGICKKSGADVFWFSPHSRCAHKLCYELINEIEKDAYLLIEKKYPADSENRQNYGKQNDAHIKLIAIVQQRCGNLSLLEFLTKYGKSDLKNFFDISAQALFNNKLSKI